jgi:hypothetical protein
MRPFGIVLIGGLSLVAGLLGIAAFWAATEARVAGTSPLAQLFTMAWSLTFLIVTALIWRRSRVAPLVFLMAMGFPAVLMRFIFPSGQPFVPSLVVAVLIGVFGCRYLRRANQQFA